MAIYLVGCCDAKEALRMVEFAEFGQETWLVSSWEQMLALSDQTADSHINTPLQEL